MGKTVDSILISLISAGSVGDRKWCVKKNSDHVKIMNGRQGDAPATWRMSVTPLAFCLYPPLHPPAGEFPTAHPSEVSRGSRHSGASAMSRPLHFLYSFDYLPPSGSRRIYTHGYIYPVFSNVRPLASAYCASVIGRFFKDAPPTRPL